MWPWEHAIVGYVVYSLACHAVARDAPGDGETLLVIVASLLPDVVDKTLFWQFEVFQSGYALGHSIFVSVPLAVLAGLFARVAGRPRLGPAFAVGYLLHLAGDVVPIYFASGEWSIRHLLWPVVVVPGHPHDGFAEGVRQNLEPYLETMTALEPTAPVLVRLGLAFLAAVLWIYDGHPGWRPFLRLHYRLYDRVGRFVSGSAGDR